MMPVYDLQVQGQPEFFADGVLVHNCRVHHVGSLPELEDQMVTWSPGSPGSPDRVDALVYGVAELRGLSGGSWLDAYGAVECAKCGNSFMPEYHPACPECGAIPDR